MMMTDEPESSKERNTMQTLVGSSDFPTTRWTLVVAAADPQRKEARSALGSLCEGYWYPLYAYVRRRGYQADQAQDLTQDFFIRVLEGRYLDRADAEKGRFRSFFLTSLKFFVADEEDRRRAKKRGGGAVLPLELSSGEDRYQREPADDETPERIFERRWALSVLNRVVERLRQEFVQNGRPEHFERLKIFLLGKSDAPYADLAQEMNTSEGARSRWRFTGFGRAIANFFARRSRIPWPIPARWSLNSGFWRPL
jgi:RNA polymerase sigma factor (sigma-70 family)